MATPLASARGSHRLLRPFSLSRTSVVVGSICILPASILEKSSTSFSSPTRTSPASFSMPTCSRCSGRRRLRSSSVAAAMTAFMGVRISWLTTARKSDLAALATSARLRSSVAVALACCRALVVAALWRTATSRWVM